MARVSPPPQGQLRPEALLELCQRYVVAGTLCTRNLGRAGPVAGRVNRGSGAWSAGSARWPDVRRDALSPLSASICTLERDPAGRWTGGSCRAAYAPLLGTNQQAPVCDLAPGSTCGLTPHKLRASSKLRRLSMSCMRNSSGTPRRLAGRSIVPPVLLYVLLAALAGCKK